MTDATNSGAPAAGGSLSGDLIRQYAIKRMERQQRAQQAPQTPGKPTGPPAEQKIRRF
jgi:hypothetical protein